MTDNVVKLKYVIYKSRTLLKGFYISYECMTTHKFFIRTYQKAPIVQHYTYNTIKTITYISLHT